MSDKLIKVVHLEKRFKKNTVLSDVTLEFEAGKIHGIIGRNGSGKTVLMKCICGLVQPTSGKVLVRDQIIGKDVDFPEHIGVIIETPGFIGYHTGFRNLNDLAMVRGEISTERIREVMRFVGLDPALKTRVSRYSLGMRQRLGIAQAVMENPEILILDEPMNGLDRDGVLDVRRLLLELKAQGKTILITSHNHEDIEVLCDTVVELDKGKVLEQ